MIKVLVTGAGGGVGQGIIKSLKMINDLEIKIIAADMNVKAAGLYSGDIACLVQACNADDYLESLGRIFERELVEYYFPGTDVELGFCAKNKNIIFEKFGVRTVISSPEAVNIADNKYNTYLFLKENGFSYPKTMWADNVNFSDLKYPLIVKPAVGCRSIGVFEVNNKNDLMKCITGGEYLLIQELVGDLESEYTCTVVKVCSEISPVLALRRVLRSGDTFRAEPVKNLVIEKYIHDVAMKLDIEGGCNFQLRLDHMGVPKIFEINCRFSGTTPFCAQLGFNPVEFYLKKRLSLDYQPHIDYDSYILRYWSEVIVKKAVINNLSIHGRSDIGVNKQFSLF